MTLPPAPEARQKVAGGKRGARSHRTTFGPISAPEGSQKALWRPSGAHNLSRS
jgi:hypothetical protein